MVWVIRIFTIYYGICVLALVVFLIKLFTDFRNSELWGKLAFVLPGILSIAVFLMAQYVNSVFAEESRGLVNPLIELALFPYIILGVAIVNLFIFMSQLYMGNSRSSGRRAEPYKGTFAGWVCENCGTENSLSANYCGSCKKHK